MVLEGKNGNKFELTIVGYEFPRNVEGEYDSNWLVVQIYAAANGRGWTKQAPALLTWEVESLTKWLDGLESDLSNKELEFMEPNIRFQFISRSNDAFTFKVLLELELRAPWLPKRFLAKMNLGPCLIVLCLTFLLGRTI